MINKLDIKKVVGADNVISEPEILEKYSKDMSFVNAVRPDYVVKVQNADQIDKIIKLAKKTATPLVPVSSGAPHFKGDTVPSVGGAVIVDLSGMKKIIRADRINRVVMFEPGVTFNELIPAVTKEGIRLIMPLLPRMSKSVVGSMLEREPVILPKYCWDISDPLSCVEIIFGTGDLFRTGAAAGPGTIAEQWEAGGFQKEAAGPSSSSWYRLVQGSQGTMGIVAWASARVEILPKLEAPRLVGSSKLEKLMEIVHWLMRYRIGNECFILNSENLAAIMAAQRPGDYGKIKESLPPWLLFCNLAGYEYFPEKAVSTQLKDMTDLVMREGLEPVESVGQILASDLLAAVQRPSGEPYWKLRNKGACQDIFFISNQNNVNKLVNVMMETVAEAGYQSSNMGVYIQPIVQGCNYHCEFNLFYDPDNHIETDRVRELTTGSIRKLIANGAFFSRPYGDSSRIIYNQDVSTVNMLKRVKSILDPDNIMNPGKLCF
jgi:hypothetical protein